MSANLASQRCYGRKPFQRTKLAVELLLILVLSLETFRIISCQGHNRFPVSGSIPPRTLLLSPLERVSSYSSLRRGGSSSFSNGKEELRESFLFSDCFSAFKFSNLSIFVLSLHVPNPNQRFRQSGAIKLKTVAAQCC